MKGLRWQAEVDQLRRSVRPQRPDPEDTRVDTTRTKDDENVAQDADANGRAPFWVV